jgi:hypothetical protein
MLSVVSLAGALLEKRCTKCGIVKPLSEFNNYKRNKNGRWHQCKTCYRPVARAAGQKWRAENPGYHVKGKLKYFYGLTEREYYEILANQGGGCAICKCKPPKNEMLCVDHDRQMSNGNKRRAAGRHAIRGILCKPCNMALGAFKDSVAACRMAADYLEAHQNMHKEKQHG